MKNHCTSEQLGKCDRAVRILLEYNDDGSVETRYSPTQEKLYHLIIRSTCGDIIKKFVTQVTSAYGEYVVVWATISQIRELLKEPCVLSIQAGSRQYPQEGGR